MKPVIIIAVAVVCSVIAVLVVLIGIQQISDNQAQVAFDEYPAKEKAIQEETKEESSNQTEERETFCFLFWCFYV